MTEGHSEPRKALAEPQAEGRSAQASTVAEPQAEKHGAQFSEWMQGARPHTWANSFAPVIAGSGVAAYYSGFVWWKALLALLVAWALIIGVNFANDYSDGIRGTDEDRSGPLRLTGSGLVAAGVVKKAAFICFGVAGLAGVVLSLSSAWWLILVGIFCILGAWFYTGGSNPYGYRGLGEAAVFVFFGLVAVMGTEFVQRGTVSWLGAATAVGIGAISASVNLANNLRDIPTDAASGKITLAVRLGDSGSRTLFTALVCVPFLVGIFMGVLVTPWALTTLAAAPLAVLAVKPVVRGVSGRALIPVLGKTGKAMLVWALLLTVALVIGS